MNVDVTHVHALFSVIAKAASELGEPGTEVFALAELGRQVAEQMIEKAKP